MKAVVVELHKDQAVVLSDSGCFDTIKNKNYEIGQVIIMKTQKNKIKKKVMVLATTAALVMLSIGTWAYANPYTYVSLDVNPSIEFTLNRFNRVIAVKAINDDGSEILEGLTKGIRNNTINEAIVETVEKIKDNGYFENSEFFITVNQEEIENEDENDPENEDENDPENETENETVNETENETENDIENELDNDTDNDVDNEIENDKVNNKYSGGIIITVSNGNIKLSEELSSQLRSIVKEAVGSNVSVEVTSINKRRVEQARELGVSPGKLHLIEMLQESSSENINSAEWLDKPVKEIMGAINDSLNRGNKSETEEDSKEDYTSIANESKSKSKEEALKVEEKAREKVQKAEEKARKEALKAEEKTREEAKKAKKAEEKSREEAKKVKEKVKEEAKKAEEKTREEAKKVKEEVKEEAKKVEEKAREEAKKVEEQAREEAKKVKEQGQRRSQEKAR